MHEPMGALRQHLSGRQTSAVSDQASLTLKGMPSQYEGICLGPCITYKAAPWVRNFDRSEFMPQDLVIQIQTVISGSRITTNRSRQGAGLKLMRAGQCIKPRKFELQHSSSTLMS